MDSEYQLQRKFKITYTPWAESHGFNQDNPGAAVLYAAVAGTIRAKTILVIGSGAGFVPGVFLENVTTIEHLYLVDAYLAETGNGSPLDIKSNISTQYPWLKLNRAKLTIYRALSEVFLNACIANGIRFDLIFIDGDHSITGFSKDLNLSLQCLSPKGAILFHDTDIRHIWGIANDVLQNRWINFTVGTGVGLFVCDGIKTQ